VEDAFAWVASVACGVGAGRGVLPTPTRRFTAAQPPRHFHPLWAGGFGRAFLLLNSDKMSQQKVPFVSFPCVSFFLEKQVTGWREGIVVN